MGAEKTFIVGDVHGCLDTLKRLIDNIKWEPSSDRLVFIGDYIDRGKDPKGVVDFVLELKGTSPLVQCLIGNHEQMFLDYLSDIDSQTFILNGGLTTLRSYKDMQRSKEDPLIPPSHLDFFSSLLPMIELQKYYVVHAGFRPNLSIDNQELLDMIWIRDGFIYSDYDFGKVVIFGHTPFSSPMIMDNKIGIDTGAVYGNCLTCLELPEERFHSVRAR
jgi:serine/threonine protein phosphatase 1